MISIKHILLCMSILCVNLCLSQVDKEPIEKENLLENSKIDQLQIDKKELNTFKVEFESFEEAFLSQNQKESNRLKNVLIKKMKRELAQSKLKMKNDEESLDYVKKEYKLAKKRTKLSKKVYKMSNSDESDEEVYESDVELEDKEKRKMKSIKRDYKRQKKLAKKKEKLIDELETYIFIFTDENQKENEKKKDVFLDFIDLMEDDIEATQNDLKNNY